MIINAMLIALVVAFVMTAVFVWGFRLRGTWGAGFSFFLIVFLMSWAGGIWVRPLGAGAPSSAPWLVELIVGFVTGLLMASSVPSWGRRQTTGGAEQRSPERRSPPVLRLTPAYWVAVVVLIAAIVII